jgi:hypothetical protein
MAQRVGTFIRQRPLLERIIDRLLRPVERLAKGLVFDCRMCGQCVLHATGMVCPMTCPKELRNGPCGGVRRDGTCEVDPYEACVWGVAYNRSKLLPWPAEFHELRSAVDWTLEGSSSWLNLITRRANPDSQCAPKHDSGMDVVVKHAS